MGRNAKLRRERKSSSPSSTNKTIQKKDDSILARASDLVKQPETSPEKQLSWSDKFWDWINPLPKADKYLTQIDHAEFESENEVLISAIAWEGFEKQGKGLVLLSEKKEEETTFKYISRYKVKKTMKIKGVDNEAIEAISELIKTYEPSKNVITVYLSKFGEISMSISEPKEFSPPECYQMLKKQNDKNAYQK